MLAAPCGGPQLSNQVVVALESKEVAGSELFGDMRVSCEDLVPHAHAQCSLQHPEYDALPSQQVV
jgi:hypothetical protein